MVPCNFCDIFSDPWRNVHFPSQGTRMSQGALFRGCKVTLLFQSRGSCRGAGIWYPANFMPFALKKKNQLQTPWKISYPPTQETMDPFVQKLILVLEIGIPASQIPNLKFTNPPAASKTHTPTAQSFTSVLHSMFTTSDGNSDYPLFDGCRLCAIKTCISESKPLTSTTVYILNECIHYPFINSDQLIISPIKTMPL